MHLAFLHPLPLISKPLATLKLFTTPLSLGPTSRCRSTMTAVPPPKAPTPLTPPPPPPPSNDGPFRLIRQWWDKQSNKAAVLRNYGVAAVISYGLFDAITYSISFLIALRAFLAAGKVLTWQTLPQVLAIMWGLNNLSRPFRIAGALAISPLIDRRVVKPLAKFFASVRRGNNPS